VLISRQVFTKPANTCPVNELSVSTPRKSSIWEMRSEPLSNPAGTEPATPRHLSDQGLLTCKSLTTKRRARLFGFSRETNRRLRNREGHDPATTGPVWTTTQAALHGEGRGKRAWD